MSTIETKAQKTQRLCRDIPGKPLFPFLPVAAGDENRRWAIRILFVAPYPPSRIRVRLYGFVSHLAKQHEVTVIALCSRKREMLDVQALQGLGFTLIAIEEKRLAKLPRVLRAIFTRLPLQVAFDGAPRLRAAIARQLASEQVDLVHVEFIRALGALPSTIQVPVVWDAVDCISMLYEQGGRAGATALQRWLGNFEARRVRAYERAQLSRFQRVLVTSARDRDALLQSAASESLALEQKLSPVITVLPHGVDRDYFTPSGLKRQPETLVFSGKMSFHANVAAVLVLVQQIMPRIWKARPGVRLVLAGSNPPASIRRLARNPLIEVTGHVSDLRPFIEQAWIAVCPLPYAVGIQNKILEAMALDTPVVASPQAAAGLEVIAGHDLLVADGPEEFAAAVLQLLDEQQLYAELVAHGRAYVTAHHNWAQIISRLNNIYTEAANMIHV